MKLIRDGIPNLAAARGRPLSFHLASRTERVALLRDKLIEENDEFLAAGPGERAEELADLLEVVAALADGYGINQSDLDPAPREGRRLRRLRARGRLAQRASPPEALA